MESDPDLIPRAGPADAAPELSVDCDLGQELRDLQFNPSQLLAADTVCSRCPAR